MMTEEGKKIGASGTRRFSQLVENGGNANGAKSHTYFALLAIFWFGICQALIALVVIIWPAQIAAIVGDSRKELYNGLLPALGSLVAFVMTPVAGVLSDYNYFGVYKRRLFMVTGTAATVLFLFCSAPFSDSSANLGLLGLSIIGVHFGLAWCSGPYAGVVLDSVSHEQLGVASGWQGMAAGFGDLIGAVVAGILVNFSYLGAYSAVAIMLVVSLIPSMFAVKEPVEQKRLLTKEAFLNEFRLPADVYSNFYWVIAARFLFEMGMAAILVYIQYYLGDVIGASSPALMAAVVVAIGIAVAIPTSMVAGPLSDKMGRKPIVYMSSIIMTLASFIYLLLSIEPNLIGVFIVAGIFGIGYGAYKSVDWALALEVIPPQAAAKDMGIWQAFMVVPKVISPLIAGAVLHAMQDTSRQYGYMILFGMSAVYFVGATVCILPVKLNRSADIQVENDMMVGTPVDVSPFLFDELDNGSLYASKKTQAEDIPPTTTDKLTLTNIPLTPTETALIPTDDLNITATTTQKEKEVESEYRLPPPPTGMASF